METVITAEQIHKDFFGAEERLYVEAIGLSKGSLVNKNDKAERLKKIGFGKAAPIKENQILQEKRKVSGHMISVIEYFRTYYPQYKFITEVEVKRLCEKYGLLLGDASNYIGDMPEKNLQDIEKFKLRKEDWREKTSFRWFDEMGLFFQKPRRSGQQNWINQYMQQAIYYQEMMGREVGVPQARESQQKAYDSAKESLLQYLRPKYVGGAGNYKKEEPKKEYEQPAFKICAPKHDFDLMGNRIEGYKLIDDPIVLQPVSKEGIEGYLIITAWGEESKDEIVVNQTMN